MDNLNNLATELFGEMRNLTKEESEALYKALDEMSVPTGINLFDESTWNNSEKIFDFIGG